MIPAPCPSGGVGRSECASLRGERERLPAPPPPVPLLVLVLLLVPAVVIVLGATPAVLVVGKVIGSPLLDCVASGMGRGRTFQPNKKSARYEQAVCGELMLTPSASSISASPFAFPEDT